MRHAEVKTVANDLSDFEVAQRIAVGDPSRSCCDNAGPSAGACRGRAWAHGWRGPGGAAGTVPGFAYSAAMIRSKIVWNETTLDRFLASPLAVVPGTAMGYAGIADGKERADLIAYLKQANASPLCAK
jgi:hypothetical protein